ncbi:MobC family plasmid mobilization relaxosome protein [Streptomyces kaniharaensis]|uniref:MobC family plasmid mobilization relaxosome protein n=1 Tax=Streptomyces kaniharaensis TaxID=212423 RepID=A0A6N7L451_9ACTN|nr:MobC family plasmid mobilization relaxosome protein [Streptomyces kaniharaensis]MQS18085.1 MobC family plasmid mobilization relaxosome protein [Streptomyces kaniharaensis]MQS18098.1 MobC family plasmid mobilization relaxosome protein [Streptomyces kaniharaensis]
MPARGGRLTSAGRRDRRYSVNLSPEEEAAWQAAREATGRKELGAWVRVVVNEAIGQPGLSGEVPMLPEVNHAVFMQLAAIGNNLNQIAHATNIREGEMPVGLVDRLEAAIEAVGNAALVVRGMKPLDQAGPDGGADGA